MKLVYFIQQAGGIGPVKIGISKHPEIRAEQLGRYPKRKLVVLAAAPGTLANEQALHARFRRDAIGHEWFRPSNTLIEFARMVALRGTLTWEAVTIDTVSEPGAWENHFRDTACMRAAA